ncbi:hypothetical protein HGRIS_000607 [Hohenbuehelia grisea]|uniref:Uncharacterized protein n=1 Tax=Hohenbuehelia grisea TaxID=104357 RepID=A0ABR3JTH1_9AGAR
MFTILLASAKFAANSSQSTWLRKARKRDLTWYFLPIFTINLTLAAVVLINKNNESGFWPPFLVNAIE